MKRVRASAVSLVGLVAVGCGAPTASRETPAEVPVPHIDGSASSSALDDEPPVRALDPVRLAASYLDAPASDFPRRARVAAYGALYAVEPTVAVAPLVAPDERGDAGDHTVVVVVEERPESLRVRIDDGEVRLVVYLRDDDFHAVVRRRARASLGVYQTPDARTTDGVWVQPGLIVSPGKGMLRSVPVDDALFAGDAWVERAAVDRVYEIAPDPPGAYDVVLAEGTVVRAKTGAALLTVPSGIRPGVVVLETAGAKRRVRYVSDTLHVEGWVPAAAIEEQRAFGHGYGTGGGGWGTSGPTRHLHAGDALHTGAGAEVLGKVLAERVLVLDHGESGGGRRVGVHLRGWPSLPLWIDGEDVAFGERWEKVYLGRVRLEPLPGAARLPSVVSGRFYGTAGCWRDALARGTGAPYDLRLVWKSGTTIDVPQPAGMPDDLHLCLRRVFTRVVTSKPPPLPLELMLHLVPTPLPER